MKLLQLGYGNMGRALLDRWCESVDGDYAVVDPAAPKAAPKITLFKAIDDITVSDFDVLVLAVKPQILGDALGDVAKRLTEGALVVSIAAGVPIARLKALMGDHPIIRIMPNLPVTVGKGMCGLCASDDTTQSQRELASDLTAAVGANIWVRDDDELDRFTAIAGSGPGYFFELARNFQSAAMALGFDEAAARALVLTTLQGTAEMALASDTPLSDLRDAVTSKKGTTEAGLNVLRADGDTTERIEKCARAAYDRAIELRNS